MKHVKFPGDTASSTVSPTNNYDLGLLLRTIGLFATARVTQSSLKPALTSLQNLSGARDIYVLTCHGAEISGSTAGAPCLSGTAVPDPLVQHVLSSGLTALQTRQGLSVLRATTPFQGIDWLCSRPLRARGTPEVVLLSYDRRPEIWNPAQLLELFDAMRESCDHLHVKPQHTGPNRQNDILSAENPFGLTRAERRVCALLGEGLTPTAIADKLDLNITTVRSHLGKLYAKTGLNSQMKLVHALHAGRPE